MSIQDTWESMFNVKPTQAEENIARAVIGKLDRKYPVIFQRAGSQRFCEADSEKETIGDAVDGKGEEGRDYEISTDGTINWGVCTNDTSGDCSRYFTVSNYNYVIKTVILRDAKQYITQKQQSVTIKDAKIKYMCQSLLNHMIG
jgi:hypothetical protein